MVLNTPHQYKAVVGLLLTLYQLDVAPSAWDALDSILLLNKGGFYSAK